MIQDQVVSNITLLQLLNYPTPHAFLQRIFSRLIALPSGMALPHALSEPPASIIYDKLLLGGATRYRLLVTSSGGGHRTAHAADGSFAYKTRRAGERKEISSPSNPIVPVWMQYGGPDRMYEAVYMGAAVIFEIGLLPRGKAHVAEHDLLTTLSSFEQQQHAQGMAAAASTTKADTMISQNRVMMNGMETSKHVCFYGRYYIIT